MGTSRRRKRSSFGGGRNSPRINLELWQMNVSRFVLDPALRRARELSLCAVLAFLLGLSGLAKAQAASASTRAPWTTSRVLGSPEPPALYTPKRVFPTLQFKEPTELVPEPGTSRHVLVQLDGKIFSFDNQGGPAELALDLRTLWPDLDQTYSFAFDPGYAHNRFVYVSYARKSGIPDGSHVTRFKVSEGLGFKLDPTAQKVIFKWISGGHNGGSLQFGRDGCLYISTGDSAGPSPPDQLDTGQGVDDYSSCILRIRVDHAENGRDYTVPKDNPFVSVAGAKPEIWAFGFRNPWKMSFDRATGDLWVGDVGWELWELLYRVQKGGNYGWSVMEGPQSVKQDGKRGPGSILPPAFYLPHSEASSITGGFVYRGKRFPDLVGAYVYGDFVTGKIWALRPNGKGTFDNQELAHTLLQVICFSEEATGELLIVDYAGGIYELERNADRTRSVTFPGKLSETGLFESVPLQRPASGVVHFSVNSELWTDHAIAERWVAVPGAEAVTNNAAGGWVFPKDTVFVKTLSLEVNRGNQQTRRRVETQLLHFDGRSWNGYTYKWNQGQTEAELVPLRGEEIEIGVEDSQSVVSKHAQRWRYAGRSECSRCHNPWAGTVLSFNASQLNHVAQGTNQLQSLAALAVVPPGVRLDTPGSKLADPFDVSASLNDRARSYLHSNCSHCHRDGAGASVRAYLVYDMELEKSNLLNAKPMQGDFGLLDAAIIKPGDPYASVLYYRISKLGRGRMPHIGSSEVDPRAVRLIHDWILGLGNPGSTSAAASFHQDVDWVKTRSVSSREWELAVSRLLSNASGGLRLLREMDGGRLTAAVMAAVMRRAETLSDVRVKDLFEKHLPDAKRVRTLGVDVRSSEILSIKGDAARGREMFAAEGRVQCKVCHRLAGEGRDFGPDLSLIGKKFPREQLLQQILEPSGTIDPSFEGFNVEAMNDVSYTGFLVRKSAEEIVIRTADAGEVRLPAKDVKEIQRLKLSLMPEQLLQGLTAQEAADLLTYLESLR